MGTIFQTTALLGLSTFHQQANKSITLLGIPKTFLVSHVVQLKTFLGRGMVFGSTLLSFLVMV
jgi:hypothetical protein